MTDHDADVAAVLAEAVRAHLSERIAYHGPYGATSEEQWQMDTEKQFVHELNDGELQAELLAALTAAGYAVVKLPEGVAVEHGARLAGTIVPYMTPEERKAIPDELVRAAANALYAEKGYADWEYAAELARITLAAAFAALSECDEIADECVDALCGRGVRPEQRREIVNEVFDVLSRKFLA